MISVFVVSHNSQATIYNCLTSILKQKSSIKFDVWLIDNASTDQSLEIAKQAHAQFPTIHLYIIKREINNLGAARAQAVELCNSPYFIFTDSDCVVPEGWIEKLYQQFIYQKSLYPNLAGVGAPNLPPDEPEPVWQAMRVLQKHVWGHINSPQMKLYKTITKVAHLPTCNAFFERALVLSVGNFNENYPRVCEDVDLGYRLKTMGYSLFMMPEPIVTHLQPKTFKGWQKKVLLYGEGHVLILKRHFREHILQHVLFLSYLLFLFKAIQYPFLFLFYFLILWGLAFSYGSSKSRMHLFFLIFITHVFYLYGHVTGLIKIFSQKDIVAKKISV